MEIKLKIVGADGVVKREHSSQESVYLGYREEYQAGDVIITELETENNYLMVELEGTLSPSLIFVPGKSWTYQVITETFRTAYHPNMFKGDRHYLAVRYATAAEITQQGNLALNPHDQKDDSGAFPHASANVETRNETTFYARNAIDGILANEYHGRYPYQSWGINQDPEACLRIDFGRKVLIDELGFILRGDYPHDSYWTKGTVTFSTGESLEVGFEKLLSEQKIKISPREIEWLELNQLIKAEDESPFPALTQIFAYGKNALND